MAEDREEQQPHLLLGPNVDPKTQFDVDTDQIKHHKVILGAEAGPKHQHTVVLGTEYDHRVAQRVVLSVNEGKM